MQQIRSIISAGLMGWERIIKIASETGGNINRSAEEGFKKRNFNKLLGSSIWFKKKRKDGKEEGEKESKNKRKAKKTMKKTGQIRVKSVIMVPKTINSLLSRRLQEMEKKLSSITKEKVKIQEVGSVSVKQLLTSSDIWSGLEVSISLSANSC